MSKTTKAIAALILISLIATLFSSVGITLFLAAIGGLIVFLGLWIENEADEEIKGEHLSSFTEDARKVHLKYKVGWWILMLGIAVEIGIAVHEAAHSEIEMSKIRAQAKKNDPLNRPIKTLSAEITLIIVNTNAPSDMDAEAALMGGHFEILNQSGNRVASLRCLKFDNKSRLINDSGMNILQYSMSFAWPSSGITLAGSDLGAGHDVSTRTFDEEVEKAVAWFPGFGTAMPIIGGECVVTINGSIRRTFLIPQRSNEPFLLKKESE